MSGPPRKKAKLTETTKAHRYETFTKRISKIKIDPVHTVQKSRLSEDHNDLTKSFFRSALDEWAELNLTTTFTSFFNATSPLTESLPQLIHHTDRVVDILLTHIEKKQELALEPLLSLIAHLAHDLGQEFVQYFDRTVNVVVEVAAAVQDAAIVECCFTCLAWLYKYLSKRLLQDLRPLLATMVPYLSAKKDYIRRFTAESLAYLLRKAAMSYSKNQESLSLALKFVLQQLGTKEKIADNVAYQTAIMTLLVESMMGVEARVHSSAPDLLECAFETIRSLPKTVDEDVTEVLEGVIVALIHQTNAEGFQPLLDIILSEIENPQAHCSRTQAVVLHLLLTAAGTRKGSRVTAWDRVTKILNAQLTADTSDGDVRTVLIATCAAVLQYSPLQQLLPDISALLLAVKSRLTTMEFLILVATVAELGRERFQHFMLAPLQQYIIDHWKDDEARLSYLLVALHAKGLVNRQTGSSGYLSSSTAWNKHIISQMSIFDGNGGLAESTSCYFQLMDSIQISKQDDDSDALVNVISSATQDALRKQKDGLSLPIRLSLGWAFVKSLDSGAEFKSVDLQRLSQQPRDAFRMKPFLAACTKLMSEADQAVIMLAATSDLNETLIYNMLSENVDIRKISLELLACVAKVQSNVWLSTTTELLLEIIQTPYLPSHARQLSMLMRRLPQKQRECEKDSECIKLVPVFSMGLLRHYHGQIRQDLCSALTAMAIDDTTIETILETALQWLQSEPAIKAEAEKRLSEETDQSLSMFECSNLKRIQAFIESELSNLVNATKLLQAQFEQDHQIHPPRTPLEGRSIALQVLMEMPEVIERRSRTLIPTFLSVFDGKHDFEGTSSDNSTSSHTISPEADQKSWSTKERRIFLELISKFVNPKVLYRSSDVYAILMQNLSNGSTEIRKLALTAIYNWKEPTLRKYEDILLRVAEEKAATTELATLLSNSDDDGSIKPHDRRFILPVLLRLLFGQLISRGGSHGSQEAKRKAILRLLFRMEDSEVSDFLAITLGRLGQMSLTENEEFSEQALSVDMISHDQQYGFLRMMASMMEVLEGQFANFMGIIVGPVLYCTARATRQIHAEETESVNAGALIRNIRRTGLQCLTILFQNSAEFTWKPFMKTICKEIIHPRLSKFVTDTTQGVSAMLQLIASWTSSSNLLSNFDSYEPLLLPTLWTLLSTEAVREQVKIFVIDQIISPLGIYAKADSVAQDEATAILKQQIDDILSAFATILRSQPSKDLLVAVTNVIPHLAAHATTTGASNQTLALLVNLLCQPHQKIQPHIKAGLLTATESLLANNVSALTSDLWEGLFEVTSGFYNFFRDSINRAMVGNVLLKLSQNEPKLLRMIELSIDLNASSTNRVDEIDFERRLKAFDTINSLHVSSVTKFEMLPLVQNLIYYCRTAEDFSIRSNAVSCLRRFIVATDQSNSIAPDTVIKEVLLPAIKKGVRDDSELIRADFVMLLGLVVKHIHHAEDVADLEVLLVGDDEEASFYTNILHIQQHRRVRAIRRLVTEVEKGNIKPTNITELFLPLLEKFANDTSGDESASGTKGHSIAAITELLKWVDWKVFRRVFRQYRQDLDSAARPEKDSIKLLSNAADALTFAVELSKTEIQPAKQKPHLAQTLPPMTKIYNELKESFITKLGRFIHHKDEAEISLRIPAAKVAVKLIKILPPDEIPGLVAPIVLDISQILRSRTQESRDIARNTLAEIVQLLGPSSMEFVLKELQTTLNRGYQLHVLSFTMHTILLTSAAQQNPGGLDYCIEILVKIIMDDIFGSVGQEKENQDYISSMKEVKSSKSFDSMEILARSTGIKALSRIIFPFQSLLTGSLTARQMRHVDDLLRRIGIGLAHNPEASNHDLLIFAYEMIQAFYQEKIKPAAAIATNHEKNLKRYLIQLESTDKSTTSASAPNLYKLVKFSIDLVRSTMLKQPTLMTAENVHGFLPIIGDAVVQGQEDVKISAFRLLSAVIKLPLKELDTNATLYVMEAVKVVKSAINTNEESSQAALKFVTALLRDRQHIEVRDADIAYLLHRTMPDLTEPDKQGVTFNFVKAVMVRQIQLPEIYEIMDRVAVMMVTNQTRSARDSARGVFVHFLLGYPQSEKRWTKQLKFLLKNLDYQYPEGRQSVMEAVNNLLQKVDQDMIQQLVSTFFLPIVLRMANDDHVGCREMAGALLGQLFQQAGASQIKTLLEPLRNWTDQNENDGLVKLSLQVWNLFYQINPAGASAEIPAVRTCLGRALRSDETEDAWELQYQALELLAKLASIYPETVMTNKQRDLWNSVCVLVVSPQTWVRHSSANLIGRYFTDIESNEVNSTSLLGTHGLKIDSDRVLLILRNSIRVLKSNTVSQDLARQTINNLLFLASWVDTTTMEMEVKATQNKQPVPEESEQSDVDGSDADVATTTIPCTQYLFDQLTSILRREPNQFTSQAFLPRLSALQLLTVLFKKLPTTSMTEKSVTSLLMPLTYITDADTQAPRSVDSSFAETFKVYTESAQLLLEAIQSKLGDSTFVKFMTDATKTMRKRREDRRQKRAIERVSEPEKAAKYKRRKEDRKKERKKETRDIYRKGRRRDLGF